MKIVEKCPVNSKIATGQQCFRCSNKLNHEHECSFNSPKMDHTHKIDGIIFKYHVVSNGFGILRWEEGWKELESK